MLKRRRSRKCPVQKGVQIICPLCGALITLPMCQAVNGEIIVCPVCRQEFVFRI